MECSCINKDESIRRTRASIIVSGADFPRGRYIAKELAEKGKHVKALVRDPFSEEAQILAEYGCTVLKGDITKPSKLWLAMRGCYGAVCLVDPILYSKLDEVKDASMEECVYKFAQRCKEVGINEFIFCNGGMADSLVGSIKLLKFKFFHCVRYPDFCFEDIIELFQFSKHTDEDGKTSNTLKIGSDTLTLSCAEDAGKMFVELIHNAQFYRKRKHPFAVPAEKLTTERLSAILSEAIARQVECKRVSHTDLKALNYRIHSSLASYFRHVEKDDKNYPNINSKFELPDTKAERSKTSIVLESSTFEDWVVKHRDELKIKLAGDPILEDLGQSGIEKIDILKRAETQLLVRQLMKASPHATMESLQHTAGSIMEMRIAQKKKNPKIPSPVVGMKGRDVRRTASMQLLGSPRQLQLGLEGKERNGVQTKAASATSGSSIALEASLQDARKGAGLNQSDQERVREAA